MKRKNILFFIVLLGIACFIRAQNIYTYAGNGNLSTTGDGGPATSAGVYRPSSVLMDGAGNLFITCFDQSIRVVNASGIINTTVCCGGGDGGPATSAGLQLPYGVAFDPLGNMYIADYTNNRIRKINTSSIISTTVGTGGLCSFGGDGGSATSAFLCSPADVSFDASGNMYIADLTNRRIRKVNTSGTITTIAGTGGMSYAGDGGPATAAQLNEPSAAKADAAGNVYIADRAHNCIRKIDPSGTITTIGGTGIAGHTGDGGPATVAQMNYPQDLVLDVAGNIFIAEQHYIRKINSSGIISTIAGTGVAGYSGDGGPAILAQFDVPCGLSLDASGNIYVSDLNNNRVRVICISSCAIGIDENKISNNLKLFPNPTQNILNISGTANEFQNSEIEIINYLGQTVQKIVFASTVDVSKLASGIYTLKIITKENQNYYSKFVKD